ncbi:glycoside hydrolase family 6 protein [Streptomyces sp. NPDC091281]|uniref:glycoside hydrolase family 6 protein n=1 Tax=Streptomyces sp. NPDC091281 TaxID=3365985 RepID=UPI00382A5E28
MRERRPGRRGGITALASAAVVLAVGAGLSAGCGASGDSGDADESGGRPDRRAVGASRTAPSPAASSPLPSAPVSPSAPATPSASPTPTRAPARLYRHPASQIRDWLRAHPDDARHAVLASRIADHPTAVWFTETTPDARGADATLTARVRAVTSGAAARDRVAVVVAYAVPDRDCGGASDGGARDVAAYGRWIDRFAAGLGPREVIVLLEPDALAQTDCLSADALSARLTALARAGRAIRAAAPKARVYYDAGHSHWNPPAAQAALLARAGAREASGIFSNVSNFRRTADEIAYDRRVLDALGGPPGLGAVIDTSRNGNGPPADDAWCDPDGRRIGRTPTLDTGAPRIDAYLWVKPPGESDGCKGEAGTFSPAYAYELAGGARP